MSEYKNTNFTQFPNELFDFKLSGNAFLVWTFIYNEGAPLEMSLRDISKILNLSRRTLMPALKVLEAKQLLKKDKTIGDITRYTPLLDNKPCIKLIPNGGVC